MDAEQQTPLEKLATALQEFVNDLSDDGPVLVGGALLVWEQARYDDDGNILRRLNYSLPTDGATLSGGLGLAAAGDALIRRDLFGDDED